MAAEVDGVVVDVADEAAKVVEDAAVIKVAEGDTAARPLDSAAKTLVSAASKGGNEREPQVTQRSEWAERERGLQDRERKREQESNGAQRAQRPNLEGKQVCQT